VTVHALTKDILIYYHHQVVQRLGGRYALLDAALLEEAARRCAEGGGGPFRAAARCGLFIAQRRVFAVANRALALAAMDGMLLVNGITLAADGDEAAGVVEKAAAGGMDEEALAGWLEARSGRGAA